MMRTSNKYIRPYKVEIYGLQDNFIGTLQSYNDSSIGRIIEPILEISTDGTQKFTCSIPKYYIDKTTNQKLPNPRWQDAENGILAENTRVLKVFIKYKKETKVYPLIIDTLVTKRDEHFSVYREITASGLAFAELGKLGYKLELTHETLEADYKDNPNTVATINYWLDKVFPNERDENGKVIKWLTPWCYEVRMEWDSLSGEVLASDKIYDSPCVDSWGLTADGKMLTPLSVSAYQEKARYIDCQYSNKYNITQTIAETYEVFCAYEYKCAENGTFIKNYTDENGNHWTGRKAVFYNRAIDMDNPLVVNYQKNLDSVSRTADSSEIYTKMYVKPIESSVVPSGLISIADTSLNPIMDDFILNFDYLESIGNITKEQAQFIEDYKVELYKINTSLKTLGDRRAEQEILKNEQEARVATYEKQLESAKETLLEYEILRDNGSIGEVVINETQGTPVGIYFYLKDDSYYYAQLVQEGIEASSLVGYSSQKISDENRIFSKDKNLSDFIGFAELNANNSTFFIKYNKENYPESIVTSKNNPALVNGRAMWLTMRYVPDNYYADICLDYENLINNYTSKKANAEELLKLYDEELQNLKDEETINLARKSALNELFENRLGPALREGYWAPDSYEDPGENCVEDIYIEAELNEEKPVSMYFDTELLDTEEKGWYQKDTTNLDKKEYFDYIDISKVYKAWSEASVSIEDLTVHLQYTKDYSIPSTCTDTNKNYYFYLYYSGEKYYFTIKGVNNPENYCFRASETANGLKLTLWNKNTQTEQAIPWIPESQAGNAVTSINIIGLSMGTCIYPSAGFTFSYLKQKNDFIPIIIINEPKLYEEDNYQNHLTSISYSFLNNNKITYLCSVQDIKRLDNASVLGYPRIKINSKGVMYESDSLIITPFQSSTSDKLTFDNAYTALKKYEDYLVTTDKGEPVFTLKVTGVNTLEKILDWPYHIQYKKTRANELLYMDAIDIAYDSSRPRYSYELTVANLPENVNNVRLGQLVQINDYSVGLRSETGYISTIKFNLDSPQDDDLTIQDYTTKFEDLFASITATNEAMKQNQNLYNTVAGSFNANGTIDGSVLQTTIANNNLAFNYSHTRVEISPTEGIILTNLTPYDNGVYGQVVLKGGGVFLSSSVDAAGNRIWSEAITPNGINASLLTAGAIDTSLIRIYSGDNLSFQWNGDGLFAYKRDEEGRPTMDAYVKYSDQGLQFIVDEPGNEDNCSVHLGWEGLKLAAQSGALTLTAQDGLQIFYPAETGAEKPALQVGRWSKTNVGPGNNTVNYYGMRLCDTQGNETFTVDNNGNLMITGTMQSGRFASGILGYGWQIRNDGTAEFQDVHVRGTISASVFEYQETTAVGGELYIGPTLIVDYNRAKEAKFSYINNQLILEADLGFTGSGNTELCGRVWEINDILGINCCLTNDAGDKYEIKNLRMRLTTINNTVGKLDKLVSSVLWDTSLNVFYDENGSPVPVQLKDIKWEELKASGPINCIFIGSEDGDTHNRKGILLTAMADDSPYMDIYDDAAVRNELKGAPKVRIGNLAGLGELSWDGYTMKPEGYGLYSDNVYLTGAIYATSGKIGSLTIDQLENKQLKIDVELGDQNGFIINTSNQNYSPTIYPKVYIDNQLIGNDIPKAITNLQYKYQKKIPNSLEWKDLNDGYKSWNDNNNDRTLSLTIQDALTNTYRVAIKFKYVNTEQEEEIFSASYKFTSIQDGQDGEPGSPGSPGAPGTSYIRSEYFYEATSEMKQPSTIDKETIEDTNYSAITPYLWQKTIDYYTDDITKVNIALISVWGQTGDAARSYTLVPSTRVITRDLGGAIVPGAIEITCTYIEGNNSASKVDTGINKNQITVMLNKYNYDSENNITQSSEEISNGISVNNGIITIDNLSSILPTNSNASSINVFLYTNENKNYLIASASIEITLGEKLRELGEIREGEVRVAGGKVYSEAIVAGQVTAGKIATGAVQAGALVNAGDLYLMSLDDNANQYPSVDLDAFWNADGTFKADTYDSLINFYSISNWNYHCSSGIKLSRNEGVVIKTKDNANSANMQLTSTGLVVTINDNKAMTISGASITLNTEQVTKESINIPATNGSGNVSVEAAATTKTSIAMDLEGLMFEISKKNYTYGNEVLESFDKSSKIIINHQGITLTATVGTETNKLILTNELISVGEGAKSCTISAGGLLQGDEASFNSLKVGGILINGNSIQYVVSKDEPKDQHNILWIQTVSYQKISNTWKNFGEYGNTSGLDRNLYLNKDVQHDIGLALSSDLKYFSGDINNINYTISFKTHLLEESRKSSLSATINATLIVDGKELGTGVAQININRGGYADAVCTLSIPDNIFIENQHSEKIILRLEGGGQYNTLMFMKAYPITISASTVGSTDDTKIPCQVYYIP